MKTHCRVCVTSTIVDHSDISAVRLTGKHNYVKNSLIFNEHLHTVTLCVLTEMTLNIQLSVDKFVTVKAS